MPGYYFTSIKINWINPISLKHGYKIYMGGISIRFYIQYI